MEIGIHNKILRDACALAKPGTQGVYDPRIYLPFLIRGSWISDMNQSTLFTSLFQQRQAQKATQRVFTELWAQERDDTISAMKADIEFDDIAYKSEQIVKSNPGTTLEDFGSYEPLDHFDVLSMTDAGTEQACAGYADRMLGKTIEDGVEHIVFRLCNVFLNPIHQRLAWNCMSNLGQALHTIADFYAHSNYIEILLWSLSRRPPGAGGLNGESIHLFKGPCVQRQEPWDYICPLPVEGSPVPAGAFFFYDIAPEHTRVVSSVFDTNNDTICFMLDRYAAHLRNIETSNDIQDKERFLDLAMALVDLSGTRRNLIKGLGKLYLSVEQEVIELGRRVRGSIADKLERIAQSKPGSLESRALLGTSAIIRTYSSGESAQWRQAGGYDYVQKCFMRRMIDEITEKQSADQFILPHHALLRKDTPALRADHALRFSLACIFATAATARVLRALAEQDVQKPKDLAKALRTLVKTAIAHPFTQLERAETNKNNSLAELVSQLRGLQWPTIPNYKSTVETVQSWIFND